MQNQYINVYNGNPTAGALDGVVVSYNGLQTNPVSVALNGNVGESKVIKLAIRCEQGYCAPNGAEISFENDVIGQWELSKTEDGTFSTTLTIDTAITNVNTIFYAKITSGVEAPRKNTSVSIIVDAEIENTED
ncbi:hypothetical protein [Selenomonas ruminantium]|uniref:hypothetical protein n=1 Tax=Selenomonas ruminantium TaxID=971 RepID=UPI0005A54792|nr:hypothetical protein [Selenomonas ruminantium]